MRRLRVGVAGEIIAPVRNLFKAAIASSKGIKTRPCILPSRPGDAGSLIDGRMCEAISRSTVRVLESIESAK